MTVWRPVSPRSRQISKKPSTFSFTPPIACTWPCWLIEPVIAQSWRSGTPDSEDISAHSSATDALSPSIIP